MLNHLATSYGSEQGSSLTQNGLFVHAAAMTFVRRLAHKAAQRKQENDGPQETDMASIE